MIITVVQNIEKIVVKRVECDKCGKLDARGGPYDRFGFDFEIRKGEYDGYGGEYNCETTTMDLCEPCTEELKKLLLANGYRLTTTEDE